MNQRDEFLSTVRGALGRFGVGAPEKVPSATALSDDVVAVELRAQDVLENAKGRADELMDALAVSAAAAEWKVERVNSLVDAKQYVVDLVGSLEARSVVRSAQGIVEKLRLLLRTRGFKECPTCPECLAIRDRAKDLARSRT